MRKEFVMRGQTESGQTEVLNFSGYKPGYAYRLTEFSIYPGVGVGSSNNEMCGSITAGKIAVAPTDPNFNDEALIAVAVLQLHGSLANPAFIDSIVNDTFLITQNLILMVQDSSGEGNPINWQCRFESVKMTDSQAAVQNFKQFTIFDE
jgi:hypothetical protein